MVFVEKWRLVCQLQDGCFSRVFREFLGVLVFLILPVRSRSYIRISLELPLCGTLCLFFIFPLFHIEETDI
jgi:hypothetical protein